LRATRPHMEPILKTSPKNTGIDMAKSVKAFSAWKRRSHRPFSLCLWGLTLCLAFLCPAWGESGTQDPWPRVASSKDGTPVSYEVHGSGEPMLLFVHGWSCDARYWRAQISCFSRKYQVVLMDLAGHGHSGLSRARYTMKAFGEDVQAVTEATGGTKVVLIGHSMGGAVIAEAARLMPERVLGLIGVDTLENVEYPLTQKAMEGMLAPFKKDFSSAARQFAGQMISQKTDPGLREWILSDMSSAPPAVAVSAMEEMMNQYITGEAARVFEAVPVPVVTVKGDLWPVDYEANRRHMRSFDAIVIEGADHFLMMNRPGDFNDALEEAIRKVVSKRK